MKTSLLTGFLFALGVSFQVQADDTASVKERYQGFAEGLLLHASVLTALEEYCTPGNRKAQAYVEEVLGFLEKDLGDSNTMMTLGKKAVREIDPLGKQVAQGMLDKVGGCNSAAYPTAYKFTQDQYLSNLLKLMQKQF